MAQSAKLKRKTADPNCLYLVIFVINSHHGLRWDLSGLELRRAYRRVRVISIFGSRECHYRFITR